MIFSDGLRQSMGSKRFCWFDVTIDSIMSTDSPVEPQIIISDELTQRMYRVLELLFYFLC